MSRVVLAASLAVGVAVKMSSYAQGAKFDKCITVGDWQNKTLDDDITLQDRDNTSGCCPDGTVPGVERYPKYRGANVICGFKADGTVAFSTGTTCTYNQCYVWKQNVVCESGTQMINGCCAAQASCKKNTCNFNSDCLNYVKGGANTDFHCATYHKDWSTMGTNGMNGTSDKTDDQAGDLLTDNLQVYVPCGSTTGGSTTGGSSTGGSTTGVAASRASWASLSVAFPLSALLTMV